MLIQCSAEWTDNKQRRL